MIILGINGWYTRSHDPSACIVKDGRILAMAEEERFIRQKRAYEKIPINSIWYCLNEANISPREVDVVAFGWDYEEKYRLRKIKWRYRKNELLDIIFPRNIFSYQTPPKLLIVDHHLAHAASTFFTSGFSKSAILVIDGQGEHSSTSIAVGEGKNIKILKSFTIQDSLGYFYESINKYIGFHYLDSGKTMGLAPYGKPIFKFDNIKLKDDGYQIVFPKKLKYENKYLDEQEALVNLWHKEIKKYIPYPNKIKYSFDALNSRLKTDLAINQQFKNLAASAQAILEDVMGHLANIALNMANSSYLCISGGVGLNCSVNGKLTSNEKIRDLHIFPCANDAGVSMGAALYAASILEKKIKFKKINHVYLGPKYQNKVVATILNKSKIKYRISVNIYKEVAELIAQNNVVGWFQGRMEAGPRALGNRSILANPSHRSMWKKVNLIKGREFWRPFAPSILEEYQDDYFVDIKSSPFMIKAFQVKEDKIKNIPAVVHVDGTARPQTVNKKINKKYWLLINEFKKITGVPILLNTSFNGPGEPIVCSPQDALGAFQAMGLDYLIINNFIISKN